MLINLSAAAVEHVAAANKLFAPFHRILTDFVQWLTDQQGNLLFFAVGMVVTLLAMFIVTRVFLRIVYRLSARLHNELLAGLVRNITTPVNMLILTSGFIISIQSVRMPEEITRWLPRLYFAGIVLLAVWVLMRIIRAIDSHFIAIADKTNACMNKLMIDLVRRAAKVFIWGIAILFIAQNIFNLNVSALIAGAGVAGLAVALAAQNTLANIFGAITIILDKPFSVGDRIQIGGNASGTVEAVGLRSTKLRALDGVAWFIPNRQMADSIIENYAMRPNLKYAFNVGLVYSTPPEGMKKAIDILHEILDSHRLFDMEKQPPMIYFTEMRDWSLSISVIVWFQTMDFKEMQNAKQEINLAILTRFNEAGLEFAFPSSTNYLVRTDEVKKA
jgi:MscS family membrane protein